MAVNRLFIGWLLLLIAFTANLDLVAQQKQKSTNTQQRFSLHGAISLDSLTKLVHHQSGVRFSFNSVKVKGTKEIVFPKANYSLPDILKQIRETTSLYYSFYSGYVVFQDNKPKKRKMTDTEQANSVASTHTKKAAGKLNASNTSVQQARKNQKANTLHLKNEVVQLKQLPSFDTPAIKQQSGVALKDDIGSGLSDSSINVAAQQFQIATVPQTDTVVKPSLSRKISDSINNKKRVEQKIPPITNKASFDVRFGLQWNINMPLFGLKEYATGTNGNNQWYTLLIPGVFISKTIGASNNELMMTVKPFSYHLTGNKTVATAITYPAPPDTFITVQANTNIVKTKGLYAGLQYNYYLNEKWNLGAGINFNWQTAALVNKQSIVVSNGNVLADSLYGVTKSSADWQYIKPTFFSVRVEATYNLPQLSFGIAAIAPLNKVLVSSLRKYRPVSSQVFIRWRLY